MAKSRKRSKRKPAEGAGPIPPGPTPPRPIPQDWEVPRWAPPPSGADVEKRFEELIRRRWGEQSYSPPADVFVHQREIWIEVDLPGVDEREVHVAIERGVLVVEATRHEKLPATSARPARIERPRGRIRRSVPLPTQVEGAQLEFRLEEGVLHIRLSPGKRA